MANQTELLNVSDEMKLDDERQSFEGLECGEGLCSSSSDTTEELYSSSAPDTLRSSYAPDTTEEVTEKSVWCKQYKNIGFRTKKFRNQEFLYGISFICVLGENKAFL